MLHWRLLPTVLAFAGVLSSVRERYGISSFLSSRTQPVECGTRIQVDNIPRNLTSQNFGQGQYRPMTSCIWTLQAPEGKVIRFNVISISIEATYSLCSELMCCPHDNLTIFDHGSNGYEPLTTLCGFNVPQDSYLTSSNKAAVKFKTDSTGNFNGFQLTYVAQDSGANDEEGGCPEDVVILTEEGTVESYGYDDNMYATQDRCRWRIQAPSASIIQLKFNAFSIESHSTCQYDSFLIYAGADASAPEYGPYCGTDRPPDFDSTGNQLFLTFISDVSLNLGKFSFSWIFVQPEDSHNKVPPGCDGRGAAILEQSEGSFASPMVHGTDTYPDNSECAWKIVVPEGKVVHLSFEDFVLEKTASSGQCYDHVSVYDGEDPTAERISYACGDNIPGEITSTRNTLYVMFRSDSSVRKQGFVALYAAKAEGSLNQETDGENANCGVPGTPAKLARIVGGDESTPHSWPWQISLRFRYHENFGHWCGGSIIARNWVVTAAHCVFGKGGRANFKVRVGDHSQMITEPSEITVDLAELQIHPEYNKTTFSNDLAVLRLNTKLQYTREVRPVCLAKSDVKEMKMCLVTGWGETQGTAQNDKVLQEVRVPIIARETCNQKTWYGGKVTNNMICAGYPEGRKDSCQGDSGGPLVCHEDGVYRLQGVVSWGFGCARPRQPGVYAKVTRYLRWIEEQTGVTVV